MKNRRFISRIRIVAAVAVATAAASPYRAPPPALDIEGVPALPETLFARLDRYGQVANTRFLDWGADDTVLISARDGETTQLYQLSSDGVMRKQLTDFDQPVVRGSFAGSERSGVIFIKDQDGDENYQIFFLELPSGDVRPLTAGTARNSSALVSNDGRRYAFTRTQGLEATDWGVQVGDLVGGGNRMVFQDPGAWLALDWSPDDTKLLMLRFESVHDSRLYVVDVATGIKAPIDVRGVPVGYTDARYSPDGRGVYYTSNADHDFLHLRYRDLATGGERILTDDIAWNVTQFDISVDGGKVAFAVNKGGVFELFVRDLATGRSISHPQMPKGLVTDLAFDRDGRRVGFTLDGAIVGQAAYALDLDSGGLTRLSIKGGETDLDLVEPEMFSYPSFDQVDGAPRQIPALIYRPKGSGPHPVIIRFHGGPEAQSVAAYSSTIQFWAADLGIAVITPNVRGSTGYGRAFAALDDGMKREGAVRDAGALLDWIASQKDLDAGRVAVYGASYGGYMTLAALSHFGDRLRGGIDIVGISNFVTFLTSTKMYRQELRRAEYGDENDSTMRAFLSRISPLTNAARITRPLLVAQGLNDPRVPASESEQLVATIRAQGGEVWYIAAHDEGHGFSKRSNAEYLDAASALFLSRLLLADDAPAFVAGTGD